MPAETQLERDPVGIAPRSMSHGGSFDGECAIGGMTRRGYAGGCSGSAESCLIWLAKNKVKPPVQRMVWPRSIRHNACGCPRKRTIERIVKHTLLDLRIKSRSHCSRWSHIFDVAPCLLQKLFLYAPQLNWRFYNAYLANKKNASGWSKSSGC